MFGASTPFGAASTPAFGAASPAPSLFGASTPVFGAPTSTPAFGASSSPAFGASSAPAFGAAPAQTSPFSFAPAAAPAAFGAASAATPFGAASTPAFGAASSAAAAFSFSSAPASQPTTPFGAAAPTQQPAVVGGAPIAPASFTAAPLQPDFSAVRELVALRDAFVPDSDKFRFQSLFLNVVPNPAARIKPSGVDDLRWREALQRCGGIDSPDSLWPVAARGFQDLVARKDAQDAAMAEHAARVATLLDTARALARTQATTTRDRVESIKRRHLELMHALLRLMRRLDAIESRVAGAMGNGDAASAARVQRELDGQLTVLQERVLSTLGLQRGVDSLVAAAHMASGVPAGAYALQGASVDERSLAEAYEVLAKHTQALLKLQDVMARAERDLAIMAAVPEERVVFAAAGR